MNKEKLFFEDFAGEIALEFFPLPESGSSRKNFVAKTQHKNYIVTTNDNLAENESFFYFSEILSQFNLNVPKIFAISEDRKMYIQQHLGNKTFSEIIADEGPSDNVKALVKQSLNGLFELQIATANKINFSKTFEYEKYDELPVQNDLFYFKSFIADILEIPYHKATLLKEFQKIIQKITTQKPIGFMIRDFQSRNIIVNDGNEVFFIDYQSATEGPLMYDVISFLYQAKANFPNDFKNEMLIHYISKFPEKDQQDLKNSIKPIQLIRYLQVLGAYGFRGLVQKKPHFVSSIHQGIENLYEFSENWTEMDDFPQLKKIASLLKHQDTKTKIAEFVNQ